jgi:hypothetical protein
MPARLQAARKPRRSSVMVENPFAEQSVFAHYSGLMCEVVASGVR